MLPIILMVFAFVLFVIAAVWGQTEPSPYRPRLVASGLACWVLAELLTRVPMFK